MILRACLILLRAASRGLARLTGRHRRRVQVVRLLPHGAPTRPDAPRWAGPK